MDNLKKRKSIQNISSHGDALNSTYANKQNSSKINSKNITKMEHKTRKMKELEEQNKLKLWKRPVKTLYYFLLELFELIVTYSKQIFTNKTVMCSLLSILLTYFISLKIPSISSQINSIENTVKICCYWIFLGILSSVGLGTGLHTFLLYLGPFIAKVTLAAYECKTINFQEQNYPESIKCPQSDYIPMTISILTIMSKVRLESFMWGAGTAIGELPPYFMARAARLASFKDEKVKLSNSKMSNTDDSENSDSDDEFKSEMKEALEKADTSTIFGKGKQFMHNLVNKVGFFGILLAASIPNPLFDLAGITCGHFLIPFHTFFGATLIGKAIIKMHIQMIFIIFLFSKHHIDYLLQKLEIFPKIQLIFSDFIDKQKDNMYHGKVDENKKDGILKMSMEFLVFSMITYFVISIINSLALSKLKKIQKLRLKMN